MSSQATGEHSSGEELAIACARAAADLKGENIRVLDVKGLSTLTDYMVLCTGNSQPHLKAVIRDIEKQVRAENAASPHQSEGKSNTRWVVLDYVDVMVHVMLEDARELYALEDLWGDARDIQWEDADED
ncbi:MAG: ribosome silencing factor [Verrucomicrobiales bacterium]